MEYVWVTMSGDWYDSWPDLDCVTLTPEEGAAYAETFIGKPVEWSKGETRWRWTNYDSHIEWEITRMKIGIPVD